MPYPESAHPYTDNTDNTQSYTIPGASLLAITFDPLTEVEDGWDYIHVTNAANVEIADSPFTGTTLAGKTVVVLGDTVKIRLVTDYSETRWGYRVTNITDTIDPYISNPLATFTPNVSASFQLEAQGGVGAPYTFSITSGTLPTGLSMSKSGLISGTPTVAGAAVLAVLITDGVGNFGTTNVTVAVLPPIHTIFVSTDLAHNLDFLRDGGNAVYGYGDNRFIALRETYIDSNPAHNIRIVMYGSTDSGATWAPVDEAHSPIPDPASSSSYSVAVWTEDDCFPGIDGQTLYVAYRKPTTLQLTLRTFDMATGLWGTDINGGPIAPNSTYNRDYRIRGAQRNDGVILIAYTDALDHISVTKYQDNVWSNVPTGVTMVSMQNGCFIDPVSGYYHLGGRHGVSDDDIQVMRPDGTWFTVTLNLVLWWYEIFGAESDSVPWNGRKVGLIGSNTDGIRLEELNVETEPYVWHQTPSEPTDDNVWGFPAIGFDGVYYEIFWWSRDPAVGPNTYPYSLHMQRFTEAGPVEMPPITIVTLTGAGVGQNYEPDEIVVSKVAPDKIGICFITWGPWHGQSWMQYFELPYGVPSPQGPVARYRVLP